MNEFDISVKIFDDFASQYAKRFKDINSYLKPIGKFCDLVSTKEAHILELACGPGNVTQYIRKRFPESKYIGIDLAPKMIDLAKKEVKGVDFRVMDVRNISEFQQKFDAIMCSFCLPFLSKEDASKLISDCADRLKPNGVIYLSSMEGEESRSGFESTSFSGNSEVFFNFYKQKDIENYLVDSGFEIRKITCQNYNETNGGTTVDMIFIGIKK